MSKIERFIEKVKPIGISNNNVASVQQVATDVNYNGSSNKRNRDCDPKYDDDDEVIILEDLCTKPNLTCIAEKRPYHKQVDKIFPAIKRVRNNGDSSEIRTPNEHRIRGTSKRKNRQSSDNPFTPSTPKPNRSTTSLYKRRCCCGAQKNQSGRSSRGKLDQDESITSDYSTPKTTRTMLTPTKSGGRQLKNGRFAHFIYRPLELNNESSSESMENYSRNHKMRRDFDTVGVDLLAIEAPPESTTDIEFQSSHHSPNQVKRKQILNKVVSSFVEQNGDLRLSPGKRVTSPRGTTTEDCRSQSLEQQKDELSNQIDKFSQCITPPITPEKAHEEKALDSGPKLPTFIPGSCNIEQVLELYNNEATLLKLKESEAS